jgi:uncharacterized protein
MNLRPRLQYGAQFAILIGLVGVTMLMGTLIMVWIVSSKLHVGFEAAAEALVKPEHANLAQWLNTGFSFFAFFIPVFITSTIANKKPFQYIGFNSKASAKQLGLVIVVTCIGLLLSGSLGVLSEKIPLSPQLLKKAKDLEDKYDEAVSAMAILKTWKDYLIALLVIALAPAIFEETLFRGGLQKTLIGWTRSPLFGIVVSSLIFSAVHFSFFGFLSRFALGMLLGYIFYYSGNIWLNILLHFLNNAAAVTQLFIITKSGKPLDKAAMNDNLPGMNNSIIGVWIITLLMITAAVYIFNYFKKESEKVNPGATEILSLETNNPFSDEQIL